MVIFLKNKITTIPNFFTLQVEKFRISYFVHLFSDDKAELLREGIIFLIHLFARAILLMKKLKIEETKAT